MISLSYVPPFCMHLTSFGFAFHLFPYQVIYFHDNLDGEIGIDEGKDLCGVFQNFASDDTTAANGSGAIIPRAASYLAGVSIMAAMVLAS